MGSDHPVRTIGQDGSESLAGQHFVTLSVELYEEIVRRPVGEVGRDGWWDDVLRALNH